MTRTNQYLTAGRFTDLVAIPRWFDVLAVARLPLGSDVSVVVRERDGFDLVDRQHGRTADESGV